jgi:hypothetical protein
MKSARAILLAALAILACSAEEPNAPGGSAGSGGSAGAGGSGGSGRGPAVAADSGVADRGAGPGGSGGGAGSAGSGGSGGSAGRPDARPGVPDAAAAPDAGAGDRVPPSAAGQGPTAAGMIVYSQDFEQGMDGITRSPGGLPVDRARIEDDPLGQRGKVMRIEWRAGDDFRTSAGTEPRSWISNRAGFEVRTGQTVSYAFGFMLGSADTEYGFAQIIGGGPLWILTLTGQRTLGVLCSCGNSRHIQLEANRWYDFRVDTQYRSGGTVRFFIDGQMFKEGTMGNISGEPGHWDGGIYNRPAGTQANRTRVAYVSNLSAGLLP